jgi:fumarate reductase subunit C
MISPHYSEHHPKWLRQRLSTYWWLGKWPYVKFILREISSVFVAWFVVYLLLLVRAVAQGEAAYRAFIEFSCAPAMLVINGISFLFITFHAITWFAVAPQAIVAHMGTKKVPPILIAGGHYGAWIVVSAVIAFFLLR